jgi:hypothetical protein
MKKQDPLAMTREMRGPWLWTNFTLIALGLWLASSPFTFGYARDLAMCRSDVISGLLLALSAALAIHPRLDSAGRWSAAAVGIWLEAAPLLLWASSPAAYLNDTLIGALAIALSVLVPMMPGRAHHRVMSAAGPEIPPGWSYNPSSWHQRAPMIALAFLGWLVSRALAARQLGYVDDAWEPFFGAGTERVLTSDVSRMWPISDAGLGAFAYTFEMLMGCMGTTTRWRTMPWMVTFFFILVVPLGLTHIVLVILQPLVVGSWCTLCLTAAFIMLLMIPLAVDEVIAMSQFLRRTAREGRPIWRTFWIGGTLDEESEDARTPEYGAPVPDATRAMFWGVSVPWTLLASAVLGLWLMFAPAVLGARGGAADQDHLVGALVLTIAGISTAEVVRAGRYLNVLLGLWLVAGQWLLSGANAVSRIDDLAVGLAVVLLSLPRGPVRERYATWQRLIK